MTAQLSIDKLVQEIRALQDDFVRLGDALVDRARRQGEQAATRVRDAAGDSWNGAIGAAADVADSIEERPLAATAIAFGVGMLLGLLLTARR